MMALTWDPKYNIGIENVWLIKIILPHTKGYTLYSNVGETDLLLACNSNCLIFKIRSSLRQFIVNEQSCNLNGLDEYRRFRASIESGDALDKIRYTVFDYLKMMEIIEGGYLDNWTITTASHLLHHLNFIWDMAISTDNQAIIEQMSSERGSELSRLMDTLTFLDRSEIAILASFNWESVYKVCNSVLSKIQIRILTIC